MGILKTVYSYKGEKMSSFGDGDLSTVIEQDLKDTAKMAKNQGVSDREFMSHLVEALKYFIDNNAKYIWETDQEQ